MKLSPKARLRVAAWFLAILLLPAAGRLFAEPPGIGQKDIEVTLVPDKTAIMAGEPVYLSLIIKNNSPYNLFRYSQDVPAGFGVNEVDVGLTATDQDGRDIPSNITTKNGGLTGYNFHGHPQVISAHGVATERVLMAGRFDRPGTYAIAARQSFSYSGGTMAKGRHDLDVKAGAAIKVTAADKVGMAAIIDGLLKNASRGGGFALNEADCQLLAIQDDRVVPYLRELLETGQGTWQRAALAALFRIDDAATLDCVKKFMRVEADGTVWPPDGSRNVAGYGLLESSYPPATEYLVTLLHDPDAGVRESVVTALLTKEPRRQAIPLLQEMTHDKDAQVSASAKDALEKLTAKNGG